LFTGDEIVMVATGLQSRSLNEKTGPMVQVWVLRTDVAPMAAKRQNRDDAICGACAFRGDGGYDTVCYVTPWQGPHQVWKSWRDGSYPVAADRDLARLLAGEQVRLTAYGDLAAIPTALSQSIVAAAAGYTAYTHSWRTCDPTLKTFAMASVNNRAELHEAQAAGWRTFRTRGQLEPLDAGEVTCPASREAGHLTTCHACQLCRGQANPAKSIAILAHGKPGNVAAFYRNRTEVLA
jgi:hypothetical protein